MEAGHESSLVLTGVEINTDRFPDLAPYWTAPGLEFPEIVLAGCDQTFVLNGRYHLRTVTMVGSDEPLAQFMCLDPEGLVVIRELEVTVTGELISNAFGVFAYETGELLMEFHNI